MDRLSYVITNGRKIFSIMHGRKGQILFAQDYYRISRERNKGRTVLISANVLWQISGIVSGNGVPWSTNFNRYVMALTREKTGALAVLLIFKKSQVKSSWKGNKMVSQGWNAMQNYHEGEAFFLLSYFWHVSCDYDFEY